MKEKKQKKIIELPVSVVKQLDKAAQDDGRSTKNLIERIVKDFLITIKSLKNHPNGNN